MTNIRQLKAKNMAATFLLIVIPLFQQVYACSGISDELSSLENDLASNCDVNNGWGSPGMESYCFMTWKSLQQYKSENESCISKRTEDVIRNKKRTT